MQIAVCLLLATLFASSAYSQQQRLSPQHFVLTNFENSNGQFRQQFLDPFGNAHGVYSYINPSGQVVRVQYSTGAHPLRKFSYEPSLGYVGAGSTLSLSRSEPYATEQNNVTVPLFTPAVVQYPAASPGQLENYRKALEEYAAQAKEW